MFLIFVDDVSVTQNIKHACFQVFLENEFKKPISNKHMSMKECFDRYFLGNIMILLLIRG